MHILVCDDDAAFAARMDEYISEWFRAREFRCRAPSAPAVSSCWLPRSWNATSWRFWM